MKKKKLHSIFSFGTAVGLMTLFNLHSAVHSRMGDRLPLKDGNYYRWKYGNVYYSKSGSGKPLLLIHELSPASSGAEWEDVIDKLALKHTVYVLDLPGCGRSDKPNFLYTQYLYDQMIQMFINDVIGEPVDAVATGYSFPILVMAHRINPDNFNRIIGINPYPVHKTRDYPLNLNRWMRKIFESPFIGKFIYNLFNSRTFIAYNLKTDNFYDPSKVKRETIDIYYRFAHYDRKVNQYLFSSLLNRYLNLDIRDSLKKIGTIGIIIGDHDNQVRQIQRSYQYYTDQVYFKRIIRAKHLPQLEWPETFYENLESLLEQKNWK